MLVMREGLGFVYKVFKIEFFKKKSMEKHNMPN